MFTVIVLIYIIVTIILFIILNNKNIKSKEENYDLVNVNGEIISKNEELLQEIRMVKYNQKQASNNSDIIIDKLETRLINSDLLNAKLEKNIKADGDTILNLTNKVKDLGKRLKSATSNESYHRIQSKSKSEKIKELEKDLSKFNRTTVSSKIKLKKERKSIKVQAKK